MRSKRRSDHLQRASTASAVLASTASTVLAVVLITFPLPLAAQVREPGAPTLSEESLPIGAGSKSVHDGSRTVREGSVGSMKSRPVRDGTRRSMKSGPISDISRGPMTSHRGVSGAESMFEASSGAVKKDTDSPLGERISAPISELGDLQEILRQRARGEPPAIADTAPE